MVKTLKKYTIDLLPEDLRLHLNTYAYVFNPSVVSHQGGYLMSIRIHDPESNTILAYLYTWTDDTEYTRCNLSEYFKEIEGIQKVADPKLFMMGDQVWGTFNTGYVKKENNQLVLFKIKNTAIDAYFYCHYKNRSQIEKNWAFFIKDDKIHALYGLGNTRVLKQHTIENKTISFEDYIREDNPPFEGYTIGTPLVKLTEESYGFIGHKKIVVKGKRMYLGKAFKFSPSNTYEIEMTSKFLIHSFKSLKGDSFKFNKNLISCSYFSGMTKRNDEVLISYGINDIDWNIISIKSNKLWA
ncbi:MAG: hypothetical protein ACI9Y7_002244 [Dokdonia sp.]